MSHDALQVKSGLEEEKKVARAVNEQDRAVYEVVCAIVAYRDVVRVVCVYVVSLPCGLCRYRGNTAVASWYFDCRLEKHAPLPRLCTDFFNTTIGTFRRP